MLEVARKCLAAYATATKANDIPTAKAHERRMLQVWATFPSFCVAPVDLAASFTPSLGKTLVAALNDKRFSRLKTSVCAGLLNLLRRSLTVCKIADGEEGYEDGGAVGGSEWGATTAMDGRSVAGGGSMARSSRSYASRRSARSAATSITKDVFNEGELDAEVLAIVRGPASGGAELPEIPEAEARRNVAAMTALAPVRGAVGMWWWWWWWCVWRVAELVAHGCVLVCAVVSSRSSSRPCSKRTKLPRRRHPPTPVPS